MPTTTNYGWTTPADTDLVKDGAAAIRTLGSSIDTSVKSLNAGTTAGDIDYYTSATAKARVAIGTNGQVLTSNGSVPSWQAAASGGMTLISTTTLSGASITLSSIPSTYNSLVMVVRNFLPATDSATLRLRFNGDSTANRHFTQQNFGGVGASTYDSTFVQITEVADSAVTQGLCYVTIPDYANAATWKQCFVTAASNEPTIGSTILRNWIVMGNYNQTTALSSFSLLPSTGNFTSGTVLLYGVK